MEDGESDVGNRVDIHGLSIPFGGACTESHFTGRLPGALSTGSIDPFGSAASSKIVKSSRGRPSGHTPGPQLDGWMRRKAERERFRQRRTTEAAQVHTRPSSFSALTFHPSSRLALRHATAGAPNDPSLSWT